MTRIVIWRVMLAVVALLILAGCGEVSNAAVGAGQNGSYNGFQTVEQPLDVYRMDVEVLGVGASIQRPEAHGGATAVQGYATAYYESSTPGKGFLQVKILKLTQSRPDGKPLSPPLAQAGDTVILKTSDTKAARLDVGQQTTFLCREQIEFVDAVAGNEDVTKDKETHEFDYCRMLTPQVRPAEQ